MDSSILSEVHKILGYTPSDEAALKKVRNVWKKLEQLRAKASKDDAGAVRAYREFLEKSLGPARLAQELHDVAGATREFWDWYDQRCRELGISELESRRGMDHQEWMARWHTPVYQTFVEALTRVIDNPTPLNFQETRDASEKMLRAYVEAFKSN